MFQIRSRSPSLPATKIVSRVRLATIRGNACDELAGRPARHANSQHVRVGHKAPPRQNRRAAMSRFGGADVIGSSPEELAAYMKEDTARWKKVIDEANIKAE